MLFKVFPHSQTLGPWALFLCPTDTISIYLQMIVKGVSVIFVSKYFCPNYCHPGHEEECGEWQENTLRAPAAHRRHLPGILSLVRRLRFCHDWNLSTETRDTWPLLRTCSATCRHVLTVIGTLWSANNSWTLNTESDLKTETRDRDLLNTAGVLGKKEKYVLICCSICISTFAVNFCVEFDKWVSPSNRELCVLCKIRLMGDWKKEIGSRLENKELLRFRQNPKHWDLRLWSPVVIFQFVFSTLCSTIRFIVLDWNVYKISF